MYLLTPCSKHTHLLSLRQQAGAALAKRQRRAEAPTIPPMPPHGPATLHPHIPSNRKRTTGVRTPASSGRSKRRQEDFDSVLDKAFTSVRALELNPANPDSTWWSQADNQLTALYRFVRDVDQGAETDTENWVPRIRAVFEKWDKSALLPPPPTVLSDNEEEQVFTGL